jgi:ectoine hydroxylase-related dioxygenase (phytanoyl-CoA dioxygenase family)
LGFQNYIRKWCEVKDYGTRIERDKELMKVFQKVPMKKGSLLLFTRELPHNIYPNKSDKFRYAQYLRMTPESTLMLTP